jgi:hypothetical protein
MGRFYADARGYPALIILKGTALQRVNHPSDHDYTLRGSERRPATICRFTSLQILKYRKNFFFPVAHLGERLVYNMVVGHFPGCKWLFAPDFIGMEAP